MVHTFYVKMATLCNQLSVMEPQFTRAADSSTFETSSRNRACTNPDGNKTWIWTCKEHALTVIPSSLCQYGFIWAIVRRANSFLPCCQKDKEMYMSCVYISYATTSTHWSSSPKRWIIWHLQLLWAARRLKERLSSSSKGIGQMSFLPTDRWSNQLSIHPQHHPQAGVQHASLSPATNSSASSNLTSQINPLLLSSSNKWYFPLALGILWLQQHPPQPWQPLPSFILQVT